MENPNGIKRAVFLDRDGTITPEIGYVIDPEDLTLLSGAAAALKKLHSAGYKIIIITNQSAVARGMMDIPALKKINAKLISLLSAEGVSLDGIYYCPHHPSEGSSEYTRVCDCRKPASGLFLKAAVDHKIDFKRSFLIGDKMSDISMAPSLGAKGILVKTGYGAEEYKSLSSQKSFEKEVLLSQGLNFVAEDISEAAGWILLQSS